MGGIPSEKGLTDNWLSIKSSLEHLVIRVSKDIFFRIELKDKSLENSIKKILPYIYDEGNNPVIDLLDLFAKKDTISKKPKLTDFGLTRSYVLAQLSKWEEKKLELTSADFIENPKWTMAIEALREDPRGYVPSSRSIINRMIDEILKENLKNALILQYRPEDWLWPLYRAHFILKSQYWFNVYQTLFSQEYSLFHFGTLALPPLVDLRAPLYIRIIGLLLHIIIDRINQPQYKALPPVPPFYIDQLPLVEMFGSGPMLDTGNIFNYIDTITNNAAKEINEFYLMANGEGFDIEEKILQDKFLPIPYFQYSKYIQLCRRLREEYSDRLSKSDEVYKTPTPTANGGLTFIMTIDPAYSKFLEDPLFNEKILPRFIELLRDIHAGLSDDSQHNQEVQNICNMFVECLKKEDINQLNQSSLSFPIIERALPIEGISQGLFSKFVYKSDQKTMMANPLKAEALFEHALDLFERPFIQIEPDKILYSVHWIFDSLIYYLTKQEFERRKSISVKRGLYAENYLGFLIESNFKKIKGPFKLVLTNKDFISKTENKLFKARQDYQKMKENIENYFKYPCYELPLSSADLGGFSLSFMEFDLAFVFHDILFVIEVKDDLFWDVKELPISILLWGKQINRKLKKNSRFFSIPIVKTDLEKKGIIYKDIREMVITQGHIIALNKLGLENENVFHVPDDLVMMLCKFEMEKQNKDPSKYIIIPLGRMDFPPYPWSD